MASCNTALRLICIAQLAMSLAAAASALSGPEQAEASCQEVMYLRLISLRDYAPGVDVGSALALEAAAAMNCSALFVRGIYGQDLGLGPQLYASATNYKTAQIIDFKSEQDMDAFLACTARQRGATARTARTLRALIPAAACDEDAPGRTTHPTPTPTPTSPAVVDIFAVRSRSTDAGTAQRLVALVRGASDRILFRLGSKPWAYYDFLGKAAAAPDYALLAGSAEFESINLLRAYWAYMHGPPSMVSSLSSSPAVDEVVRVQMSALQLKGPEGLPSLREGSQAASLTASHVRPLAFSS